MNLKRILHVLVGLAQEAVGLLGALLAVLLVLNIVEAETVFSLAPDLLPLYLTVLGLFSVFSIINGMFLIRGGQN
jgi:hypothetical protein